MEARPPRSRRRLAAALLSALTFASVGTLAARADSPKKEADLVLYKTVEGASNSSVSVPVDGTVTYDVTVKNLGDGTTDNNDLPGTKVVITDHAPDGISFQSAEVIKAETGGDRCSTTATDVECDIHGNINPGGVDYVEVRIRATVVAAADGERICNHATVSGNHPDHDLSNNTNGDTACITVGGTVSATANLSIKKTASATEVPASGTVIYTLTAHNNGPDEANDVVIEDQLPDGVKFDDWAGSHQGCTVNQESGHITCSVGSMAKGQDFAVSYSVDLTTAAPGTSFCNHASVTSSDSTEVDPDTADNTAMACVGVRHEADLSIVKTADRTTALIGEPLVYKLQVHNAGPNTATGVVVSDPIPGQAAVTDVSTSQGSCDTSVMCNLGSMDAGASATVRITVKPKAKGMVDNTATVSSGVHDPDASNNTSTVHGTAYVALTGSAYGESVDVKTLIGVQVQSGPLASVSLPAGGGGPFSASALSVQVSNGMYSDILRLDALSGTTQGGRRADGDLYVNSAADVTKVSLANGLITLDALHSECLASTGTDSASSSRIANLRIAGVAVNVAAGANSQITVPGVGQLILNEQGSSGSGLNQSRFVNGLHLKLKGLLAQGDVVLAHSDCGIDP